MSRVDMLRQICLTIMKAHHLTDSASYIPDHSNFKSKQGLDDTCKGEGLNIRLIGDKRSGKKLTINITLLPHES